MRLLNITTVISGVLFSLASFAQQKQAPPQEPGCDDPNVHSTLVAIDANYENQGYNLAVFQTIPIASGAIVPVYIKMDQGKLYQINFVANPDFQQFSLVIIDKDKNKLLEQKVKNKGQKEHFISQNFIAPYSGNFLIAVSQKLKSEKEACAGVSILKAGEAPEAK